MAEIRGTLGPYRVQEEQLLNGLKSSRSQINPVTYEMTKDVIGELGASLAGELFGMRSLGRKVGRALVSRQDKQGLRNLRQTIESQHNSNVTSILDLLSSVSEKTGRSRRQNSHTLMRRISRAQGFTRLRRGYRRR
jgi:hypothetical protein